MAGTALSELDKGTFRHDLSFVSSWIRERNEYYGEVPVVTTYVGEHVEVLQRSNSDDDNIARILRYVEHKTTSPGMSVLVVDRLDYPVVAGGDEKAFRYYMKYLVDNGYLTYCEDGSFGDSWAYAVRLELKGRSLLKSLIPSDVVKCTPTPWNSVNESMEAAYKNLIFGRSSSDFQNCAHSCREALVRLSEEVYDASLHGAFSQHISSYSNALTKLELVAGRLLNGNRNKEERSSAKQAISLASKFAHAQTVDRKQALNCYISAKAVVEIVDNTYGHKST